MTPNESPRVIVSRFLVALDLAARANTYHSACTYFQRAIVRVEIRGRAAHWRLGGTRISYSKLCDYLVKHAQRRIDEHAAKEAKAKLIAAAPDLLAVLQLLLECPGVHTTEQTRGETYHALICAALAKAGV
jgi:hypothetical protein